MKIAYYICCPHIGGTWTVFRYLKELALIRGIRLYWLWAQYDSSLTKIDVEMHEEGILIKYHLNKPSAEVYKVIDGYLNKINVDMVIVNLLSDIYLANFIRCLDKTIKRVIMVHSISPATIEISASFAPEVHKFIAVSKRVLTELVRKGVPKEKITLCEHCISDEFHQRSIGYLDIKRRNVKEDVFQLKIAYVGRYRNMDKGIFKIPKILSRAKRKNYKLFLFGEGDDRDELMNLLTKYHIPFEDCGPKSDRELPFLLSKMDVLIFPSNFEGFGISIIEAMALGVVPVCSRIEDVTDQIVLNSHNGFLFDRNDISHAASLIDLLLSDKELLERMALNCMSTIASKYRVRSRIDQFDSISRSINLDMEKGKIEHVVNNPIDFKRGFIKKYLPERIKHNLKRLIEK
jgi:glycosyltransferase involved in cell wall biosynthesis